MTTRYIEKPDPDLSANQLAEYLNASFVRQESILRSAKYQSRDSSAHRVRYKESREAISRSLASNRRDASIIQDKITYLQGIIDESSRGRRATDFIISDSRLSIEALRAFLGGVNRFNFDGFTFTLGNRRPPRLVLEAVEISVRPDVVITAVNRNQDQLVGGLLSYFSKDADREDRQAVRQEMGLTAATLIHEYASQHLTAQGEPTKRLCLSLDVFGRNVHVAPTSSVRRMENIRAACRSIASRWPSITPPDNWPR
jgi:hypothetical protein